MQETLIILDFGSQYTQLIARRVREQKVFCKILPFHAPLEKIVEESPLGVILSGSPANVYGPKAPLPDRRLLDLKVPILGICYGLQVLAHTLHGKVHKSAKREYGFADLHVNHSDGLFYGLPSKLTCWMSHGDKLDRLPKGFEAIAHTDNSPIAAIADFKKKRYGVQFHPEVVHTPQGAEMIGNFLFRICSFQGNWTPASFVKESIRQIRDRVGNGKVVLGLSGGVDSSVAALLIHKAIGKKLTCIFVDNGLLRYREAEKVKNTFRDHFKMNLRFVDARKDIFKSSFPSFGSGKETQNHWLYFHQSF